MLASGGREALEALRGNTFALMVCDILMPEGSGLALFARVRADYPRTTVVMVTAVDVWNVARQCLSGGAYGYVIKPLDRNEIVFNVMSALERHRLYLESLRYQERLEADIAARTTDIRLREEEIR